MPDFKVGDRVRRINSEYAHEGMVLGGEYTVSEVFRVELKVEGNNHWYAKANFELVEKVPKKRKWKNTESPSNFLRSEAQWALSGAGYEVRVQIRKKAKS